MKRLLILLTVLLLVGCQTKTADKLQVAVSIVPQETFVKAVAGDLVDVVVLIPPGFSPANYQPTPKEIEAFNASKVYFHIDVPAEEHILESVPSSITLIDLAESVDEVYPARFFEEDHDAHEEDHDADEEDHDTHEGHHHEGRDPHIWLSPKRVKVMVESIRDELIALDPDNEKVYTENAAAYLKELDMLDQELVDIFSTLENKSFIMYHPSFGYFADDYGLEMHAIEAEGKKATIQELEHVIETAQAENIKYIFYQEEFDSSQAEIVAKEIDGETIKVVPLSGDYLNNLRDIALKMKNILK